MEHEVSDEDTAAIMLASTLLLQFITVLDQRKPTRVHGRATLLEKLHIKWPMHAQHLRPYIYRDEDGPNVCKTTMISIG